ncbi:MAG: hypothetical protein ACI9XO_002066 [Paraglaciecola sp.]
MKVDALYGTAEFMDGESEEVSIEYMSTTAKVDGTWQETINYRFKIRRRKKIRYVIAKDMTWRVQDVGDVLECFTLRWLVKVFFQDWKQYEAWGQLTKHVGEDGSRQYLNLSLLSHPMQAVRIKDNLALYTLRSLRNQLSIQSLLLVFEHILEQPNPKAELEKLVKNIDKVYKPRVSSKHMSGRSPTWESSTC